MKDSRWNRPKQAYLVENGQVGDCWACCIAAVLDIPRAEVPHFLAESSDGRSMDADTQRFLNQRGLVMVLVQSEIWIPRWANDDAPPLPVIAAGPTPRSKRMGQHHAVVMVNDQVVYDPHPSDAGLTAITDRYLILPMPTVKDQRPEATSPPKGRARP